MSLEGKVKGGVEKSKGTICAVLEDSVCYMVVVSCLSTCKQQVIQSTMYIQHSTIL